MVSVRHRKPPLVANHFRNGLSSGTMFYASFSQSATHPAYYPVSYLLRNLLLAFKGKKALNHFIFLWRILLSRVVITSLLCIQVSINCLSLTWFYYYSLPEIYALFCFFEIFASTFVITIRGCFLLPRTVFLSEKKRHTLNRLVAPICVESTLTVVTNDRRNMTHNRRPEHYTGEVGKLSTNAAC